LGSSMLKHDLIMNKRRTLFVQFDQVIGPEKVSAFRGAIIEKVGRQHHLFHQHCTKDKLIYRYPLIQYKRIQKHPGILCLGEGVDEIHKLFGLNNWAINLKGKTVDLSVDVLTLNSFEFGISQRTYSYKLVNWIGLNEKNYQSYQKATGLKERLEILERVLIGNILSMAKGLNWHINERVEVAVQKISRTKSVTHKNTSLISFDLELLSNVKLPDYIGLGKSVSHGFGIVIKKND